MKFLKSLLEKVKEKYKNSPINISIKSTSFAKVLIVLFLFTLICLIACFLFTKNYYFIVVMNIFLGLTMLVAGLIEFKKGKKIGGWMLVCVFILFIFTAILTFFSYNLSSNFFNG